MPGRLHPFQVQIQVLAKGLIQPESVRRDLVQNNGGLELDMVGLGPPFGDLLL